MGDKASSAFVEPKRRNAVGILRQHRASFALAEIEPGALGEPPAHTARM